jgi:hypothetical protein
MMDKKHIRNKPASNPNLRKDRKRKTSSRKGTEGLGLLAFGSSPGWQVSIDEAVDGEER